MAINDYTLNSETLNGDPFSFELADEYQNEILNNVLFRLAYQFHNKENIRKIVEIYLEGLGEVKNQEFNLRNLRSLYSASGVNLDVVGAQLGISRKGAADPEYRREIYIHSLVGASEGTREDIISIVKVASEGSVVKYMDVYPASFQIFSDGLNGDLDTAKLIKDITPAGVGSNTVFISSHGEVPFVLSESLLENPTLALENLDDYISEAGQLISLVQPVGSITSSELYGGGLGETDESTGELIPNLPDGSPLGYPLSEAYQL